jgi:hypothetical protein
MSNRSVMTQVANANRGGSGDYLPESDPHAIVASAKTSNLFYGALNIAAIWEAETGLRFSAKGCNRA